MLQTKAGVSADGVRTFDVQMTSRKWMFIQVSHITMCPLYVSPFFNSTSCKEASNRRRGGEVLPAAAPSTAHDRRCACLHGQPISLCSVQVSASATGAFRGNELPAVLPKRPLTTGCPCAVFNKTNGSIAACLLLPIKRWGD
jgi:hypothetical protein